MRNHVRRPGSAHLGCQVHVLHVRVIIQKLLQHFPDGLHLRCQPHHAILDPSHALQILSCDLESIVGAQ